MGDIVHPSRDFGEREEDAGEVTSDAVTESTPPVVVVGASAGGVEALRDLVALLPRHLRAAVLVVLHLPPDGLSALPLILRRAGDLPVRQAVDGAQLRAGEVLVAPPNHHLVVIDGSVSLTRGPQENGHRPAIDVLFRSAARACGDGVLGIVLSGALDDGAAGAVAIAARGGRVAVQDFDQALYSSMPRAAATAVGVAEQLSLAALAELARAWAEAKALTTAEAGEHLEDMDKEVGMSELDPDAMHDHDRPGDPSGFGCPDCGGALFKIEEGGLVRYRCRVGHAWSSESLLARQAVDLEGALWMALRSLEEKASLNAELASRAAALRHDRTAARFTESAREATRAAELVRQLIADIGKTVGAPGREAQLES